MTRPPLPYSGLHRPAGRILLPFRSAAGPNNLADCSAGMYSPAGYSAGMYNPAGRSAGMYSLAGCPAAGLPPASPESLRRTAGSIAHRRSLSLHILHNKPFLFLLFLLVYLL